VTVPVDLVPRLDDVVPALVCAAKPGDVVITLGAGSIGTVADRLVASLGVASSAPATGKDPS
jgi:UDP-N-acetylmuramate-alanine ligase